jgi:hypothetical protein
MAVPSTISRVMFLTVGLRGVARLDERFPLWFAVDALMV